MRPRSLIGVMTLLLGGCVMPFSGRPSMDLQRGMTRSEVVAAMGRPDGGWSYPTGEEALQWEWDHWNDGRWGGRYVTAVFDAEGRLIAYGDRPLTVEELRRRLRSKRHECRARTRRPLVRSSRRATTRSPCGSPRG